MDKFNSNCLFVSLTSKFKNKYFTRVGEGGKQSRNSYCSLEKGVLEMGRECGYLAWMPGMPDGAGREGPERVPSKFEGKMVCSGLRDLRCKLRMCKM